VWRLASSVIATIRSPNVVSNISGRSIVSLLTTIATTNDFNALQVADEWLRKIPTILLVLLFLIVQLQGTTDQPDRSADQCTDGRESDGASSENRTGKNATGMK